MALKWLYSVDREGVRVTPDFMERLQSGNAAALRSLQKRNLTDLYRNSFTRAPRRADDHGLFWSDIPETALIQFVGGGRSHIRPDRKSVVYGKSVSVRVDLGGRRIFKQKKTSKHITTRFV